MRTMTSDIRAALPELEAAVSTANEELALARANYDQARSAWQREGKGFKAAQQAKAELEDRRADLAALRERQAQLLRQIGGGVRTAADRSGPRGDHAGGSGWERLAHELRPGGPPVELRGADFVRPAQASVTVTPPSGLTAPMVMAPFVEKPMPRLFVYPVFPLIEIEPNILAIADYKQTGSRTVTGEVERDPVSTDEKAWLDLSVELQTLSVRQLAILIIEVPLKLYEAIEGFQQFLVNELTYQLDLALDSHVLNEIHAAAPPFGESGETLIEQARNAVAAMHAVGVEPSVLALPPGTAAELDTQKAKGSGQYVFATRDTGSASPLFGLNIVESMHLTEPMLIDPKRLGVLYMDVARAFLDPFTEMGRNNAEAPCRVRGSLRGPQRHRRLPDREKLTLCQRVFTPSRLARTRSCMSACSATAERV